MKPELVYADNCSAAADLKVVYTELMTNRTETSNSLVRKWIVTDACGNNASFIQTVNVTLVKISLAPIESTACNASEETIDLSSLLPAGTPDGTWSDVNNTRTLQGSIFTPLGVALGTYAFEYTITGSTCPSSIIVNMIVNADCEGVVLGCGTILVHNAISPNGDALNEKFVIDNIEDAVCYPENTVEIYNREGLLVFETKNYNNTDNAFDGTSRGKTFLSQSSGLPSGTYFYILNYTSIDNQDQIQTNRKDGYLYLAR